MANTAAAIADTSLLAMDATPRSPVAGAHICTAATRPHATSVSGVRR
ncbi:MAG TPA: hypothetical protein VMZ73_02730 [Acidimicrobiales bacterium]|nr:hypothetical protein [Acidimicrobiales bacterium]